MENNLNNVPVTPDETVNVEPTADPAPAVTPVYDPYQAPEPEKVPLSTIKTKVRKCYNSACLSMLIQFGIATFITSMITGIYSAILTMQFMLNDGITDPEVLEKMVGDSISPAFLLLTVAISYLIANVASYFIGNLLTKRHYKAKIFGKIQMKPLDCILAIVSVIGLQMLSAIIQSIIASITGMTGVDETTSQMLSFSDNIFQNIILITYTVVIAAITEELLMRGLVLKALSPVSKGFALVASSLLFGVMHGNFNQMFNGFLLGMVIGYAAIKSRSIILPIIMHVCANAHAMLWGILEFKFGEKVLAMETLYIFVIAILGVFAAVVWIIRNGKPKDETDGFPCTSNIDGIADVEDWDRSKLTWLTLIKSPMFWVFMAIYIITAIGSITPLT